MKGLFWSSFQKKLVSFDEWMTDAETNIGDLEMDNGKKKMMGGGKMKYMEGGMSKKTRADTPTGGRTRSVGIGGDTSRIAMQFKKNHPGVVKSLGYGNKSARREYSKGGMASAMKSSKPC